MLKDKPSDSVMIPKNIRK